MIILKDKGGDLLFRRELARLIWSLASGVEAATTGKV